MQKTKSDSAQETEEIGWHYDEFRCPVTHTLICRFKGMDGQIERKHPKKQFVYYFGPGRYRGNDIGPKGMEFEQRAVTLKCKNKNCVQTQAKVIGYELVVETECSRCGFKNRFDLEKLHTSLMGNLSKIQKELYVKRLKDLF